MSNLLPWLTKRREKFYVGDALQDSIDSFLKMVDDGAEVREFPDAIIVVEEYGLEPDKRLWLLFDKFNMGVVRVIKTVSNDYGSADLYASTHDIRIRNLLVKLGYSQYDQDANDFWLVKQGDKNGL